MESPDDKQSDQNQLVRSDDVPWRPLDEPGVQGVFVKVLRRDPVARRARTILLKFEAGTTYPAHNHPSGEEVYVLQGDITLGKDRLRAGDFLYTAPDGKHAVHTEGGCVILVVVPEEVERL
ncbi:MAG: cupin domain-containing protein [Candidatus Eisenbacteria bacterium]|nr:cupin domain-containing protein [Candidatus Eisenbacteria bacterium]